ncbi:MAG TPA: hypothetical protein VN775_02620, partial [Opitutaceae bacterium]|nr:hypothetical protein [Opitutaceae bacterium]
MQVQVLSRAPFGIALGLEPAADRQCERFSIDFGSRSAKRFAMLRENIVELPAANLEDAALQSKERGVVADFESGSVVLLTEV